MQNTKNIKKLCGSAVMAALFVALEYLSATLGKMLFSDSYQLPLGCFPLLLAAVLYGPLWASGAAFVGAFLSQVITYGVDWSTLLWILPTVIYTLSAALLYIAFRRNNNRLLLGAEFFVCSIILSVLNVAVNYIFNYVQNLSNALLKVFLPIKLGFGLVFAFVFAVIVPPIVNRIRKLM